MRALVVVVALALAGCSTPGQPDAELLATSEAQLRAFYEGDVAAYRSHLGPVYTDFSSCNNYTRDAMVGFFVNYLESGHHAEDMAWYGNHTDLVDWQQVEVRSAAAEFGAGACGALGGGEQVVAAPGYRDSPLYSGWYHVWRETEEGWRIMGGD